MKIFSMISCLCVILTVSAGCSSLKTDGSVWNPLKPRSDRKVNSVTAKPVRMAVVWKDSVYEQPGAASIKGFGGRFFIYDAQSNPIQTDGELVVYGYDESNPLHADGSHAGADKKFVFPSETFQRHFSDSDLGASYSVWIPWEKVGGIRKSITLIPIFKTTSGNVLECGQSMIVLPGRKPEMEAKNINGTEIPNTPNLVAQASFQQSSTQHNHHASHISATTDIKRSPSAMRTTTLDVPSSLAKRLNAIQKSQKLPTLPSQTKFPHPNRPAETNNIRPNTPSPLTETDNSPNKAVQPRPKVFGMPGSF